MDFNSNIIDKISERKDNKLVYQDNLKNSGVTIALSKAKYLGGFPEVLGEKKGKIVVKTAGLFFEDKFHYNFLFVPIEKIVKAEFSTVEQISKNPMLSRILAVGGYDFAFNRKNRDGLMFMTLTYKENDAEINILFKCKNANKIVTAVTKIILEYAKAKVVETDTTVIELMKELSVLRAMSVLTEEEYVEKKKELLSRI